MVRLNKYLSDAGVCSRREADRLIESGQVSVDGQRAVPGMKVADGQEVKVGKKVIRSNTEKIVLAVNKPAGIVCTEDVREKKNIIRYLKYPIRVTYAGRLDKDSEGLLIMTNDGDLINGMMRARHGHEKEYKVTVNKPVTQDFISKMKEGIRIVDKEKRLDVATRPCKETGGWENMFHHPDPGAEPPDKKDVRGPRIQSGKTGKSKDYEYRTGQPEARRLSKIDRAGVKGII